MLVLVLLMVMRGFFFLICPRSSCHGNHPVSASKANCSCLLWKLFKFISASRSSKCRRHFVGSLSGCNGSTYYQNIIKKALIQSCTNFTEGFDALCNEHFPTQRLVVDWCINIIINNNNMMSWWLKIKYICAANDAKKHWLVRRQSWLQQEQYLNGNDFRAELNRSNAEFFEEVRKAIGCAPKRWHPIN